MAQAKHGKGNGMSTEEVDILALKVDEQALELVPT
jgi:hypothetical protein